MLNDLEQEVVDNLKVPGLGAYLQWGWLEYPEFKEQISEGKYPTQTRLKQTRNQMRKFKSNLDSIYLYSLPKLEINPLQLEQKAWELFSPKIKLHLIDWGDYIDRYSPENVDSEQLLAHLDCGWNILQQLNILSKSYLAKYSKLWDEVDEREEVLKQLIQDLSTK